MSQSAHDWASPDPQKNMTLAEADQLRNELAAGLGLQFGDRFIRTQYGQIIGEAELRANQYLSPLPVNLFGHLVPGGQEFNIAEFRTSLRAAALSDDPTGFLTGILLQTFPHMTNVTAMFTRIPAVQDVILSALKKV